MNAPGSASDAAENLNIDPRLADLFRLYLKQEPRLPRGDIDDPRNHFDNLLGCRLITNREFNAGVFYRERYDSDKLDDYSIRTSLDKALKRRSAFAANDIRTAAVYCEKIELETDIKRLRDALSYLAMHLEQIGIGLHERAAGRGDFSSHQPG